jgi:hypothetical protein
MKPCDGHKPELPRVGSTADPHRAGNVSGHPLLMLPAMAAVKQWRYQPTYVNKQPVEVETDLPVGYNLTNLDATPQLAPAKASCTLGQYGAFC